MKNNRPTGVSREAVDQFLDPDRDIREAAVEVVCLGFCEYFKGEGGEAECGGFSAVMGGIESGRIDPSHLEHLVNRRPGEVWRAGCLIDSLCFGCGYRTDGCDYLSPSPPADATPCGGYRLLQALLDCRALTQDQVRTIIANS